MLKHIAQYQLLRWSGINPDLAYRSVKSGKITTFMRNCMKTGAQRRRAAYGN